MVRLHLVLLGTHPARSVRRPATAAPAASQGRSFAFLSCLGGICPDVVFFRTRTIERKSDWTVEESICAIRIDGQTLGR